MQMMTFYDEIAFPSDFINVVDSFKWRYNKNSVMMFNVRNAFNSYY